MTRRFYIRYPMLQWNDIKWFYGILLVAVVAIMVFNVFRGADNGSFIPILVLDVLILGFFYAFRRLSYLETSESRLRIRYLARRLELPYQALSRVRKQPLQVAFQAADRRRYANRFVRRLARDSAAYIRIDRRQQGMVEQARKRLGERFVYGLDLVVPITDLEDFLEEMRGRLRGAP
jgi:hypothetical protein